MIYRFIRRWFGARLQWSADGTKWFTWRNEEFPKLPFVGLSVQAHEELQAELRSARTRIALYDKHAAAARKGRAKKKGAV